MKRFLLLLILFAFISGFAFSYDFGLLMDQRLEADNETFVYHPVFVPWFSWDGGNGMSAYLSGILSLKYRNSYGGSGENSGWGYPVLLPEISRFCFMYRPDHDFFVEAGRVAYSDCLGMTAYGLFDGVRLETALSVGSFSAGLFFTGLQYKETAHIIMTEADAANFVEREKYFASSRFLTNVRYDMPLHNLPLSEYHILSLEALLQFDLNGEQEFLHSQYGQAVIEFYPQDKANVAVGILLGTMESNSGFSAAFGALARFRMALPTPFDSGIKVTGKFTSGPFDDTSYGFSPVSSHALGIIFSEPLSGLAMLSADYTARLNDTLLADAALLYFIRTYNDPIAEGNMYGCELQASIAWQPLDDLRLTLGSGLFFPALGNVYADKQTMWKIKASLLLSF